MVINQDHVECPHCHSYDVENHRYLVRELDTKDQSRSEGCTVCGYGFQEILVPRCGNCGVDFNTLLSNLEDAHWMLEDGYSVRACPICGCTQTILKMEKYDVGVKWLAFQIEKTRVDYSSLSYRTKITQVNVRKHSDLGSGKGGNYMTLVYSGQFSNQVILKHETKREDYVPDPIESHIEVTKRYWDCKTDAPTNYGVGMAYFGIGHLLGHDVVNLIQPKAVYHRMYMAHIGQSTTTRKSTSQDMGLELIPPDRLTDNDVASQERLVEIMSKKNAVIQPMGEFSKLLKGIKTGNYQATLAEVLNEIFGCKKYSRSKKSLNGVETQYTIEEPYLSIVSTCTPEVLKENVTREMACGGLLPRWVLNPGEAKRRPRARLRVEAFELQTHLTENLILLDQLDKKGAYFELSDEALKFYNEVVEKEVYESPEFANVDAFGGRYLDYVIAFADINLVSESLGEYSKLTKKEQTSIRKLVELLGLVELVEDIKDTNTVNPTNPTNSTIQLTDRIIVQKRHVQRAWAFLKPCLIAASELVTYVDMGKPLARVREYIKKHGQNGQKVYHSDMMRMANVDAREAELAVRSLKDREEIEQGSEPFTGKNNRRTQKVYYLWISTEEPKDFSDSSNGKGAAMP